jgi:hypothetical protein
MLRLISTDVKSISTLISVHLFSFEKLSVAYSELTRRDRANLIRRDPGRAVL